MLNSGIPTTLRPSTLTPKETCLSTPSPNSSPRLTVSRENVLGSVRICITAKYPAVRLLFSPGPAKETPRAWNRPRVRYCGKQLACHPALIRAREGGAGSSTFSPRLGSGGDPPRASRSGCRVFRSRVRRPVGLFRSPSSPSGVESSPGSSASHFATTFASMTRSKLPEMPYYLHTLIHELDVGKPTTFDEGELLSHGRCEVIQTSALQKS